jgi:hypothetical protein
MRKSAKASIQLIDKPHYGYWQALFMACYSNLIYLDAAKRWRGFGLPYLLLFSTLLSVPFAPGFMRTAYQIGLQYINPLPWPIIVALYPMVWIWFVTQVLVYGLFFASIGQLFARVLVKQPLAFRVSFRLMLLAATPALGLLLFLMAMQQFQPGCELLLVTILAVYYTLAVVSLKRSNRLLVLA